MKELRRATALSVLTLVLFTGAPAATAAADNAAVAINERDDAYVWRQAFKITRSNGDDVLESNGAAAISRCERCRTSAVAFQVLIATGTASTVAPDNVAIAFNEGCLSCATYAGAFQLIVTPRTPVHFTEAGNAEIDRIRERLQTLVRSASFGPSLVEIDAFNDEVASLFDDLVAIVSAEMVRAGGGQISTDVDVEDAA
jgi:hypothetical protein